MIHDDAEWRIRLDRREAAVIKSEDRNSCVPLPYTSLHMVDAAAGSLANLCGKADTSDPVSKRMPFYKLRQPAPFDIHRVLQEDGDVWLEREDMQEKEEEVAGSLIHPVGTAAGNVGTRKSSKEHMSGTARLSRSSSVPKLPRSSSC